MRKNTALHLLLSLLLASTPLLVQSCGADGTQFTRGAPASSPVSRLAGSDEAAGSPSSVVRPGVEEEIWIIARDDAALDDVEPDGPGTGCMLARHLDAEDEAIPVPLKHTDVRAAIDGFVATVDVTQSFHNPFTTKIEAVYTFPLPSNSAVHEFVMVIGERRIRGLIREREEAERTYLEARRQGYTASLLVQERPNVFTQAVANIEPGKEIDVEIRYIHTLTHHDGWFEYRFPMVVAPRYNPAPTTDGIGAIPRGENGASGQEAEVSYLRPTERSGHDISLAVLLTTGMAPAELHSPTHAVDVAPEDEMTTRVTLRAHDSIPNRDFVLRYRLGGDRLRGALTTSKRGGEGYFALLLMPPTDPASLPREAIELVFVVDRSGSMSGSSMDLAQRAVRHTLQQLTPADTFNIVSFADDTDSFRREAVAVTEDRLRDGLRYMKGLDAGGGTEMVGAVRAAFPKGGDGERKRCVAFLTDGHVGNEAEVLELVAERLGAARVFSFAIGSASNQYLAESMARLGRGAVAFLGADDDPRDVMDRFLDRVTHPALTEVEIHWAGLQTADIYPKRIPDLCAGRPVVVTGRFAGHAGGPIEVEGSRGGRRVRFALDAAWDAPGQAGIPLVWARRKLASLADEALVHGRFEEAGWRSEVRDLALAHGLLSDFTAFLAVDSARRTEGDHGVTVPVPVPVPEGMRYETTVGGGRR